MDSDDAKKGQQQCCVRWENKIIQLLTNLMEDAENSENSNRIFNFSYNVSRPEDSFQRLLSIASPPSERYGPEFWERRPRKVPLKIGELSQEDNTQGF